MANDGTIFDLEAILTQKIEAYTPGILAIMGKQGYRGAYTDAFREEVQYVMETRAVPDAADLREEHWRSIQILGHTMAMRHIEALIVEKRAREETQARGRTAREDRKLKPGRTFTIEVNQGWRPAITLAVIGDQALIEYTMPKGSTALRIVDAYSYQGNQRVSYNAVPFRWLWAIVEEGRDWNGTPQQRGGEWAKSAAEMLQMRKRPRTQEDGGLFCELD